MDAALWSGMDEFFVYADGSFFPNAKEANVVGFALGEKHLKGKENANKHRKDVNKLFG